MSSQPDAVPPLEGEPSGVTEPGGPVRRRALRIGGAIAVALAVIWAAVALGISSGDSASKATTSVVPNGPPASTLKQSSQTEKLGSDGP